MRKVAGVLAAVAVASLVSVGLAPGAAAAEERVFIGYGPLPSDAHADAVRQMQAYSPTCQEISTVYSPAGSAHTWKATLTALC